MQEKRNATEYNPDKFVREIRSSKSKLEAVNAAERGILTTVLARADDIRKHQMQVNELYKKDENSQDIEVIKAARDGAYQTLLTVLDNMAKLNAELERAYQAQFRLRRQVERLEVRSEN